MDKIKIDIQDENKWIREAFNNVDEITLDQLLNKFNDLLDEVDELKEKIKEMKSPKEEEWVLVDDWF